MDREQIEALPWSDVESSNIARVAFVAEPGQEGTLYVEFKGGQGSRTYTYEDVPLHVYENLLTADSVGRYFAHVVKARPDLYRVGKVEIDGEDD
jgi:hypothetical protein